MRDEKEKEEYNIHKGFSAELISKKAFLLILLLMLLDHMIYLYQDYQLIHLKDIANCQQRGLFSYSIHKSAKFTWTQPSKFFIISPKILERY